jgi:hypothetical protein
MSKVSKASKVPKVPKVVPKVSKVCHRMMRIDHHSFRPSGLVTHCSINLTTFLHPIVGPGANKVTDTDPEAKEDAKAEKSYEKQIQKRGARIFKPVDVGDPGKDAALDDSRGSNVAMSITLFG